MPATTVAVATTVARRAPLAILDSELVSAMRNEWIRVLVPCVVQSGCMIKMMHYKLYDYTKTMKEIHALSKYYNMY
jgi:hypothetical protein